MTRFTDSIEHTDSAPTEEAPNIDTDMMIASLIVGSGVTCDIVIGHHSVSAEHLRITQMGNGMYRIIDLGSEQGTFIDGYRKNHFFVNYHDAIQIGQHPLEIQWLASHFDNFVLQETEECSTMELASACMIIGREPPAEIVIPYPVVSPRHAEIRLDADGMIIRDLDSEYGTLVNGERIDNWVHLSMRDKLTLGNYHVPKRALFRWRATLRQTDQYDALKASFSTPIPEQGVLFIGRDPNCEIIIDHPTVSWRHAQLIIDGEQREIIDLGSANGTFVDGKRVTRSLLDKNSDVRIGTVSLQISQERVSESKRPRYDIRLDVDNVSKVVGDDICLLSNISLSIYPGEMVALMGPSGAGKTTLLELLSGRRRPTGGEVRLNGKELHSSWIDHRQNIGFVPQEDIMHRDLTVFEVLYYAAKLRLPNDLPESAIVRTVERLLTRMGLVHIRSSIIGDETVRGISGGQRKRVNIAIELITEPSLLFLDEPTSGLDATSTLEVLRILRALADSGKTVIMTIHQPRFEAYEMMDGIILLASGGKLAYYGPAGKTAVQYFEQQSDTTKRQGVNPADFLIDSLESRLVHQNPGDWELHYQGSLIYTQYVTQRLSKSIEDVSVDDLSVTPPWWLQFVTMLKRYRQRKSRDKTSLIIQLSQAPVISGLLGLLFWNQSPDLVALEIPPKLEKIPSLLSALQLQSGLHPTLFLIGAAAFWLGCSNVARELVSDRAIFSRERRTSLRTSAYLSAIFIFQLLLATVQTFVICAFVWLLTGLSASFVSLWGVLLLTAAAGISMGLLISAFAATEVTAISLIPLFLLPQLFLGGYVKLFGLMELSMYQWQSRLAGLMPIRWSFEAVAVLEYNAIRGQNENLRELVEVIGFNNTSVLQPCLILVVSCVICLVITWNKLLQSTKQ